MLTLSALEWTPEQWDAMLLTLPDRTPFQTSAWMKFLSLTQHATPVVAGVYDSGNLVGYFTGAVVQKFGVRILGSPFPGWTTGYMGFNLLDGGIALREAVDALRKFAFDDLRCMHLEFMDRKASVAEMQDLGLDHFILPGYEIDLTLTEKETMAKMTHQCRTNVRKAEKCGVTVEEATDAAFADEYYDQVENVFSRQGLAPTFSRERVQAMVSCLQGTGIGLFLRARDSNGRCIATSISVGAGPMAYLWGAASLAESQILRPNELSYWTHMKLWKQRGARLLDMGGGGDYKRKYGGREIAVPWFRQSKNAILPILRYTAERMFRLRQRVIGGRLRGQHKDENANSAAA